MLGESKQASLGERMSDQPVKTASAIAVVIALAVLVTGALGEPGASVANAGGLAMAIISESIARPAYPALAVAGLGFLVRG